MAHKQILATITALALVTMACGFSFNLPIDRIETGPIVEEEIQVALPEGEEPARLFIGFGAGELNLEPGTQEWLVQGKSSYNLAALKPVVRESGGIIRLESGELEIGGIPDFGDKLINRWDLQLADVPMHLEIAAGAYKGKMELGGLSLVSLEVSDGAAESVINFSEPNRVVMEGLRYKTGASNVRLNGLANANFETMIFKGGAGDYQLNFSGDLQQDATVVIDAGMCTMTVIVPVGVNTRLLFDSGLANVDIFGNWQKSGEDYYLEGEGATLTINVNLGAGKLILQNE
jgi:hypothetical protein